MTSYVRREAGLDGAALRIEPQEPRPQPRFCVVKGAPHSGEGAELETDPWLDRLMFGVIGTDART